MTVRCPVPAPQIPGQEFLTKKELIMMMNRRTFSAALVAGAGVSLISTRGMAAIPAPVKAHNEEP
jgi:hypothetical protein